MTKFNLSNFTRPKNKKTSESETPQWVTDGSPKIQSAYRVVLNTFEQLLFNIETGKPCGAKDKKIVLAQVAKAVGVDRSYLTPRRTPELCLLVDELNKKLNSAWKKRNPQKSQTPQSKSDLQKEVTKYKRLYNEELDRQYSEVISELLASDLYDTTKRLRKDLNDLKVENKELYEKVSNLTARLRSYTIKGLE